MSTAIVPATDRRTDAAAFEPGSIEEALKVSGLLVASRLLPRGIATPEAAFALIVTGRELGLSAMQALRSIHIVEGKPTLSADLMVALVKRSEACLFFRLVESSAERAIYEAHRRGEPSPTRLAFTIEEARAAGVATKENWRRYPAAMLRARCAAALARAVFPDLVLGVYDPDELAPVVDVTPAPAAPAPAPAPAPIPAPVEAAPATRRRAKAEPAPAAPPAPVEEVVEAEVVETAAPAASSSAERLVAAIGEAANVDAARALLSAAPVAELGEAGIAHAFGALLTRCTTAAECNLAANCVVEWRRAGAISEPLVETLRVSYKSRKDAVAASVAGKA